MINRNIAEPVKPIEPDVTMNLFEENPEWDKYYNELREYENNIETYKTKQEVLARLDALVPEFSECLEGDRENIERNLEAKGVSVQGNILDEYIKEIKESMARIEKDQGVLANIAQLKERDTVGISYLNDELKVMGRIDQEQAFQPRYRNSIAEEIAVQKILSEHSDGSFSSMKNIYDVLKSLGYEGNFGELEKFIPAFEHMNAVDKENRELKNKNKELSEKNELLTISNSNLQQENDNLHEENSNLKDENTNLKEKMQEIVQNVKKYKDFVLETVRNMPVIGKFIANKIQKEDRALNSGMDR